VNECKPLPGAPSLGSDVVHFRDAPLPRKRAEAMPDIPWGNDVERALAEALLPGSDADAMSGLLTRIGDALPNALLTAA